MDQSHNHTLTSSAPALDPKAFRAALGAFATGVTVITTMGRNGERVGLTANSFNSVSLDPPLVLWSLAKKAMSLVDFQQAEHWAVHVLAADQAHISNQFARSGTDKFAGVDVQPSVHGGVPLLPGCAARFECRAAYQYEGGDHIIFVGEVLGFERSAQAPLVFHAGQYALASAKGNALSEAPQADEALAFHSDILGYLLGRARRNFLDGMRAHLSAKQLSDYEWRVLTMVMAKQAMSAQDIGRLSQEADTGAIVQTLQSLCARGWLRSNDAPLQTNSACTLTEQGFLDSLNLLAAAKSHEAQLLAKMGGVDGVLLKNLLHTFIQATDSGQPSLWDETPHKPSV